ncbi:MAG: nucleotidyltransferase domain-containing protein [Oscillospiraceae bacterium]|nr:nucleotidyltransferase domain-containing protein [Oscillospiraceae bacterium]
MKQSEMLLLVPRKLKEIEKEYGIRILYAAESGSRAWGTNSPLSDFDVRFIYIRPREDYLRLEGMRDVLEFPISDGWDMCGWDLTKTLRLLHNSNSQIYEWFASPVVYIDDGFSKRFRPILDACFSIKTTVNHYLHQADLKGKKRRKTEMPKVKHYLYSLQHIAAAKWVLQHHAPVPISFRILIEYLPESIREYAEVLLKQKTTQTDAPFTTCISELEDWLLQERNRISGELESHPMETEKNWDLLNQFFLSELQR